MRGERKKRGVLVGILWILYFLGVFFWWGVQEKKKGREELKYRRPQNGNMRWFYLTHGRWEGGCGKRGNDVAYRWECGVAVWGGCGQTNRGGQFYFADVCCACVCRGGQRKEKGGEKGVCPIKMVRHSPSLTLLIPPRRNNKKTRHEKVEGPFHPPFLSSCSVSLVGLYKKQSVRYDAFERM